jgi:hypothetical protein
MVQVECPWCDGPAVVESVDAPAGAVVRCEGCAVSVELAPEGIRDSLARAA